MNVGYLSVWRSRNRPCTPVDCLPSGNTHHLWPAVFYTRYKRSSAGDTRSPAPSGPPAWVGCPAGTQRTLSRISFRQKQSHELVKCSQKRTNEWNKNTGVNSLEEVIFTVHTVSSTEAFISELRLTVAALQAFTVPVSIQNLQDEPIHYVLVTTRANRNICRCKSALHHHTENKLHLSSLYTLNMKPNPVNVNIILHDLISQRNYFKT